MTKTFRYTGRARWRTKLTLAYDPPGDQPIAERFRLTVKVR